MKITLLPVGEADVSILQSVRSGVSKVFGGSLCSVSEDALAVPEAAYNALRRQYVSAKILSEISGYAENTGAEADRVYRVLGIADVDLYVPGLNFVFGEAQCPGKAALISLFRLRPEFYSGPSDEHLFQERAVKEAVHEIGHTLGLRHCPNPSCVMHFSLHIGITDQKRVDLCEVCRSKVERTA